MTKSWRISEFAPEARAFYQNLEKASGRRLYHPTEVTRFCLNQADAKRARRRLKNPRYADVLDTCQAPGAEGEHYCDEYGSVRIRGAAWVDLPAVLQVLRSRFLTSGQLRTTDFRHETLARGPEGWNIAGEPVRTIVFCEGAALTHNPWFNDLPLRPAKGETLLCRGAQPSLPDKILHHRKWLLPYANGSFRLGATYDEADSDPAATEAGREELARAYRQMHRTMTEFEVVDQLAGHRPSTVDARPLLGKHPDEPGLFVLNGLGAKGASSGPTLSRELTEYLLDGQALHPEADIRRFQDTTQTP